MVVVGQRQIDGRVRIRTLAFSPVYLLKQKLPKHLEHVSDTRVRSHWCCKLWLVASCLCASNFPRLKKRGFLSNRFFFSTSYVQKCFAGHAKRKGKGQGGQNLDYPQSSLAWSMRVRLRQDQGAEENEGRKLMSCGRSTSSLQPVQLESGYCLLNPDLHKRQKVLMESDTGLLTLFSASHSLQHPTIVAQLTLPYSQVCKLHSIHIVTNIIIMQIQPSYSPCLKPFSHTPSVLFSF